MWSMHNACAVRFSSDLQCTLLREVLPLLFAPALLQKTNDACGWWENALRRVSHGALDGDAWLDGLNQRMTICADKRTQHPIAHGDL